MTLLIAMLPFYLFGNLHCMGMCGPLVMTIARHRYRSFYFLGRLTSFTLAGTLAGAFGAVINLFLDAYHIPAFVSFLSGGVILIAGIHSLVGRHYPGYERLARLLAPFNQKLSLLMLKDKPWPTFLFGFFTLLLPCGQTLIVFSACALFGDVWIGFVNGLAFAVLTSPALFFAMHAHQLLWRLKRYHHIVMGSCAILIGTLALCRGLADMEIIPHFSIHPGLVAHDHIVFF